MNFQWHTYKIKANAGNFPGASVVKTLSVPLMGLEFNLWLGIKIPYAAQHAKKKKSGLAKERLYILKISIRGGRQFQ